MGGGGARAPSMVEVELGASVWVEVELRGPGMVR